jgi:aryl-alcohol dehydrogenase-like predicted oxidoreductase
MSVFTEKLILGTVQFGLDYGINNNSGKISISEVDLILKHAYSFGITTLDTAEVYGDAHEVIGSFHSKFPLSVFKVITKMPKISQSSSVINKVRGYLDVLKLKSISTFMFHSYDAYIDFHKNNEELKELKKKELAGRIGVSVYTNEEALSLLDDDLVEVIQLPFNLLDNKNHRGNCIDKLKKKEKEVHVRSVFLQGLFFKNISKDSTVVQSLSTELNQLKDLAERNDVSLGHMALMYCLQQKNVDHVVIGVDSLQQLSENIILSKKPLGNDLVEEINNIFVSDPKLLNPSMW